jgi:hypothetical protein
VKAAPVHQLDEQAAEALVRRIKSRETTEQDGELVGDMIKTLHTLSQQREQSSASIKRLLGMIFGHRTEKTATVLGQKAVPAGPVAKPEKSAKRKGHGRLGAKACTGAERVEVTHQTLRPGMSCPACLKGLIRDMQRPSVVLRFCAQPMIKATAYVLEQLRCSLCQKIFTAALPPEAGTQKYDDNVAPSLAVMRYGFGLPGNRAADLQRMVGVPLPAGTQWDLIAACYEQIGPIIDEEMLKQAAEGEHMFNDDTTGRVLELEKQIKQGTRTDPPDQNHGRTGVFTTGVVSINQGRRIVRYKTGDRHAGENLQVVLDKRPDGMDPPMQMSDGASRNEPESPTVKTNCNAHARREFVEIADSFPAECEYVLETFKTAYKNDAQAAEQSMTPDQRLAYHQEHSKIPMDQMKLWMEQNLDNHLVEPNSGLGKAFKYILKRWENLTAFLRIAGAPLDNNICERALKTPIRHRDNSLFYKTINGARIGDFFMGVIQTCRHCGANPFDYLSTLRQYSKHLASNPAAWMPWNYKDAAAAFNQAGP